MSRSLRVQKDNIDKVKLALRRNGFPSQRSLAEEVGFALATVNNFLTGKPVDYKTFEELSRRLALDWKEISALDFEVSSQTIGKIKIKILKHSSLSMLPQIVHPATPMAQSHSAPLFTWNALPLKRRFIKKLGSQEP